MLASSPLSLVSSAIHRILADDLERPVINQYTSAGYIVWYCSMIMCCVVPLVCLSIWFFCKRCSVDDALMLGDDSWRNDNLDLEISRIEANVNAFSQFEKNRKKIKLLRAFKKHTETVTKEQERDPEMEEESPVVDDSKNEFELQLSMGCRICLDKYEESDKVIQSSNPSCKHMFHQQCILEWLSSREAVECPCCRQCFMDSLERSLVVDDNSD